jgi:PilZ domain
VVTLCLFLYSKLCALEASRAGLAPASETENLRRKIAQREFLVSRRIVTFSEGIEQSLSAIMFFARVQLGSAANPQTHRDLREVMERIDQIQLLLHELQQSVKSGDTSDAVESSSEITALPAVVSSDAALGSDQEMEFRQAMKALSLRKSARKVVIMPITVTYLDNDTQMRFQTYTVNVCEDGACIVFSEQSLDNKTLIGIQMPKEFRTQANIRWTQPSQENSFRLAGVQFVDRQVEAKSL